MAPDWITAVSTIVYVIATIFIVRSNNRIAKSTQGQVNELQLQFQVQNRPYVCIRFEQVRGGLLCISFENTGNTPARDIKVSINETFIDGASKDFRENLRKLTQSSIFLSPRQKLYCCIGGPMEFKTLKDQILSVELAYFGNERSYKEHMDIDMSAYGWVLLYESPLADISSDIGKISKGIENIQRKSS